jgi:undecaprenyl-diphosphatase
LAVPSVLENNNLTKTGLQANADSVGVASVRQPWHFSGAIPLAVSVPLLLFLAGAVIGEFEQAELEFPIIRWLNRFAHRSLLLDNAVHALTTLVLLQGAVFIALIWYLWFACPDIASRARLISATLIAALAGAMSRTLQLVLPSHLRPLHTPELGFVLPYDVDPNTLNHFNSFPSDHGVVFFGLAAIIYRLNPRLGIAGFVWAAVIDIARVYDGYHYPSDIVGAAGLGLLMVWLSQRQAVLRPASRVLVFEQRQRPLFYMLAILATYQIASLFDDVREIGSLFVSAVLHHDPFHGG